MDLSKITKKTFKVSRGFSYTYYTHPAQDAKPTILLFHGFPDSAHLWAGLINEHLVPKGYGVIAVDCLGSGSTSKPTNYAAYAWNLMARDMVDILDAEEHNEVISAGHDWGCGMAQRFYNFYPDRVRGLILINVGYMPPDGSFDLDGINKMTAEVFGYPLYDYWYFFTADDGPDLMKANLESVYSVAFGDPETWKENFTTKGGMRRFVSGGHTQETLPYATPEHKKDFMDRYSSGIGFHASNCWYKAYAFGVQNEADRLLPEENKTVRVPTLYWGAKQDYVCRTELMDHTLASGVVPNCKVVKREGGHWALLEKPDVFGQDLLEWLHETY